MKKLNQQGAVAMISVVIFSIILSILVAAYARTVVSQQRQSVNYDLSTRAYYAAEAGVQDAIRELADAGNSNLRTNGKDNCTPFNTTGRLDGSESIGYTCQLVDVDVDQLPIDTTEGETTVVGLQPINLSGQGTLNVSWYAKSSKEGDNPPTYSSRTGSSKLFPPTTEWTNGSEPIQPVLRLSFVSIPKSSFSRSDIKQQVFFLNPTNGTADIPSVTTARQAEDSVVQNGSCDAEGCEINFNLQADLFNNNVYLVQHSLYGAVEGSVKLTNSADEVIKFEGSADIDVTGRAGDVFRRVKQKVELNYGSNSGGEAFIASKFDSNALIVGDGICKFFTVGTTPTQYQNQCN